MIILITVYHNLKKLQITVIIMYMKKLICIVLCLLSMILSGCNQEEKVSETRIVLDTVATITAECSDETVGRAFDLVREYENKFSRTVNTSEVWAINNSKTEVSVSSDTLNLINAALYYSRLSGGKFDITVCSVTSLYDFGEKILPDDESIKEALGKIDYRNIKIDGSKVLLADGQIDLGAIAKGYITDRVVEFLKENGAKSGTVNLGGNVYCFGNGTFKIGVQNPFGEGVIATIESGEGSFVTSGTYQRYIEKDGIIYHHIIDPATGYGVENDLASVTVIGKSSMECDALSTVCMLMGSEKGIELIDSINGVEAVFVTKSKNILLSDGLTEKNGIIVYK